MSEEPRHVGKGNRKGNEKWKRGKKKWVREKESSIEGNKRASHIHHQGTRKTQRTALLTVCTTQLAIVHNHENTCRSNQYSSSCARMRLGIGYSRAIAGNV